MGDLLLRLLRKPEAKRMEAVERMALGAQHAMHLVRVGEKMLLVITGPGCCEVREVE